MAESEFLKLPPELILACLANLPVTDLVSCLQCGNRLLRDIILKSVLLRYRREQERAGVQENPHVASNLVIADRLEQLLRREANWLSFTPRSTHTIPIDFQTTGLYDLTSDVYLVGDAPNPNTHMCTGIKYTYTSPGSDGPQWRAVDGGKSIIDFGTAFEEHDLIAMVTYTPHDHNPQVASIDVLLLSFSTGASHPLAAHPTLHIHDVEVTRNRPGVSIEIVGQTLALSLVYWSYELRDMDTLHLYNWKSGAMKMDPFPVYNTGLVFLTHDILVLPNSVEESLDVYHIPEDDKLPRSLLSFHLPELVQSTFILSIQCRGAPNPRGASVRRPSRAAFLPRPSDAILLFSFQIGNPTGATEHMFVVHRGLFAASINLSLAEGEDDENPQIDVEWEAWGPRCTHWLDAAELSTQYITTTAGQRLVTIAHEAPETPAPIRMLDFNAASVETQLRTRGLAAVDGPHAVVRAVKASSQHPAFFERPIVSELPYVETTSKRMFDYGAVLINDENIIGARFGDRTVEELEVLHFG
ncbi:hypothetical protein MVEN_02221100 [Mycena venus]|uniref:F-box domain-containing protein n=1 Tax=Mycena venus TaxID=2733690 RepID=A0A8H6X7S3_9AGAR|nr:hypothetical protein MVEN_02221100 [Mycena venus]